jgi:hypothetical protein
MVGSGTDTYDPVCELPEGHDGFCKSSTATDQHRLSPMPPERRWTLRGTRYWPDSPAPPVVVDGPPLSPGEEVVVAPVEEMVAWLEANCTKANGYLTHDCGRLIRAFAERFGIEEGRG